MNTTGDKDLDKEKAAKIQAWLEEKDVRDIQAMDIEAVSADMDGFVIGTAQNERLAAAATEHLLEKCKEAGYAVRGMEGRSSGRWVLVDLSDIVIHIFQKEERELYNLEKLWGDGMNTPTIGQK
ncbi:MAG: ribosome silencing factor [Eubacteriaceae bacterium]|nr:ribosome silencing factor [Eubacteriaceae bacterium]